MSDDELRPELDIAASHGLLRVAQTVVMYAPNRAAAEKLRALSIEAEILTGAFTVLVDPNQHPCAD